MKKAHGRWEFSPQWTEALEKFERRCLETEPIPKEYSSQIKPVYFTEEPKESSEQEMSVDETEESSEEDVQVPEIQASQFTQLSQNPVALDVLYALEDGKFNPECLKELPLKRIKRIISKLSDSGVLYTSGIVCKSGNKELASLMCTDIFLPKLSDEARPCSRSILEAMKQLASTYPAEVSLHLLGPLIVGKVDNQQTLSSVISSLAPQHKLTVIRTVVETDVSTLAEWQATLLQTAIVSSTDTALNEKLITLLLKSGQELSSSAKFGQLLITVIKKIGPSLTTTQKQYIAAILGEHKTVARKIGEKALSALG